MATNIQHANINILTPTFNNFNKISFTIIALVGLIIKIFFYNDYSDDGLTGPANSNLWGYGIISFAILGLLFVKYSESSQNKNFVDIQSILNIFKLSIPAFLLLIILYWLIMLNINYFTKINKGEISSEFKLYSFVSSFIIFLQLFVVYKYFNADNEKSKRSFTLFSYLLSLSNIILIGIMTIILLFFSTDG